MEQPQNTTGGRTLLQIHVFVQHVFVQHALEQDIPKSVEASDIFTIDRSGLYGADEIDLYQSARSYLSQMFETD